MDKGVDTAKLAALLDWYRLAGVDAGVGDMPADGFAASLAGQRALETKSAASTPSPDAPSLRSASRPPTAPASAPIAHADHRLAANTPAEAVLEARRLATAAASLDELKAALAGFEGCALKKMAKNLCFADGTKDARLMLVGEAPGRDEDIAGVPFVGRAGQLLDKMLAAIDLERTRHVWITNTVFWRPPGNRTPSIEETEICRPFLKRQIELLQPDIIVALGGAAAKHLLQTTSGIMRLRGKWRTIEVAGSTYRVLPTLHPAYLLRNAAAKQLAWRDLLAIREAISAATGAHDPPSEIDHQS